MAKIEKTPAKTTASKNPPSKGTAPSKVTTASFNGTQQVDEERLNFSKKAVAGGFAVVGLVLGLLTGASHWPEAPATISDALAKAIWVGASMGYSGLDQSLAVPFALLGAVVGGTLGFTIGLPARRILACWTLGGLALAIGMLSTHNPIIGLMGWLLGYTIGQRGPVA